MLAEVEKVLEKSQERRWLPRTASVWKMSLLGQDSPFPHSTEVWGVFPQDQRHPPRQTELNPTWAAEVDIVGVPEF